MRDHRGEQRPVQIGATWLIAAERLEGAEGEAAPLVDILQQIFSMRTRGRLEVTVARNSRIACEIARASRFLSLSHGR